ncbi:MAG TPA: VOC family protein [Solirubrobacteraceae bacterium]|nr:VOC family protein [Solirubrobacteraceae bacterium]
MRQTLYPAVRYADADAALAFLIAALDAREREVYRDGSGAIHHGEIEIEGSVIFIGEYREAPPAASTPSGPPSAGQAPMSLYLVVADPDAHHARAAAAGATVTRELVDTDYGSREYSIVDPEGNGWSFGTYDPSS